MQTSDTKMPGLSTRSASTYLVVGVLWGLGAICLFIPFMNAFLSPLFFVLGAIYAWTMRSRTRPYYGHSPGEPDEVEETPEQRPDLPTERNAPPL